jgi:hypothetical protein
MKKFHRKYYLLNYVFLAGILILFLNDHFFKWEFSNWVTGKLSDFIGILIFPMFLTYLLPRRKVAVLIFTGLFFIFWKSPYSQSLINNYNDIALIKITRVVDYSDLIALLLLPFSLILIQKIKSYTYLHVYRTILNSSVFLVLSAFVFMATSPPRNYYLTFSEGNLKFFNTTTKLRMTKAEILKKLQQNGIKAYVDTLPRKDEYYFKTYWKDNHGDIKEDYPFYKIDTIIIDHDTIRDFQFSLREISAKKTKVYLNSMNISENIQEEEVKKEIRKYYRKLLKKYIKSSSKD